MSQTDLLSLPYILPGQAQKHVTHNEAIRRLDAIVQLAVASRAVADPPAAPDDGERHIVASGGMGAWSGQDGRLAAWQDGAWAIYTPTPGWLAWVADEARLVVWTGVEWTAVSAAAGGPVLPPTPVLSVNGAAAGFHEMALDWTVDEGDISGFEIAYQRDSDTDWTGSLSVGASETGLTVTGLESGTTYRFRIRAAGSAGPGDWSALAIGATRAYDVYVDGALGDDSGAGSKAAPLATLDALRVRLNALGIDEPLSAHVATGVYVDQHLDTSAFKGQAEVHFAEGCRMQWTQVGVSMSAIQANGNAGSTARLTIYGNGLEIDGFEYGTGNGLGCNWATLIAHDVTVTNCSDGMSAHAEGHLEAYRCRATDCKKYAVAHVNASTSYHEDCFFQPGDDPVGGVGTINNDLTHVFERCTFLPPPNSGSNKLTFGAGTVVNRCELGGLDQQVQLAGSVNASRCYVQAFMHANADASLQQVFGTLTIRMRDGGDIHITDSVLVGTAAVDKLLFTNYTPAVFGDVAFDRCVVTGYGSAAVSLSNSERRALWDASNSAIHDCVFFANGADFDTAASTAQRITNVSVADPGLGTADTLVMADYAASMVGVGFGASDAVSVGAPASVRP